jgi:dTDP-4-dehydrorhamnose 3,5-epimerase
VAVRFIPKELPGVVVVELAVHRDRRGFFVETFHAEKYAAAGIHHVFVQDNHSSSVQRTVRGLHLQVRKPQAKLVRVIEGHIWDVAVDVRPGSATFGAWIGEHLSAESFKQLYIPAGYAHGFCVLSETAQVEYKCSELYDAADEVGIRFDDPQLAIPWPVADPIVSERDRQHGSLSDFVASYVRANVTPQ